MAGVRAASVSLPEVIVAATKGGASKTLTITYDAKGRITAVTENTFTGATIASGTYTGNGDAGGQAIAVAFRPKIVFITDATSARIIMVADPAATDTEGGIRGAGADAGAVVTTDTATVDITAAGFTAKGVANTNLDAYKWVAIG